MLHSVTIWVIERATLRDTIRDDAPDSELDVGRDSRTQSPKYHKSRISSSGSSASGFGLISSAEGPPDI